MNLTDIEFDHSTSLYQFSLVSEEGEVIETFSGTSLKEIQEKRKKKSHSIFSLAAKDSIKDLLKIDKEVSEFPSENPLRTGGTIINYDLKIEKAKKKAEKVIQNMLSFYLSEEFIEENEYIMAKKSMDSMDLEMILINMDHIQRSLMYMMQEFDSGNLSPRMFEVFAAVQKSFIDLLKTKNLFMLTTEEHLKKLRNDYDFYGSSKSKIGYVQNTDSQEGLSFKGTKGLLDSLDNLEEDDL